MEGLGEPKTNEKAMLRVNVRAGDKVGWVTVKKGDGTVHVELEANSVSC